MKIFPSRKRGRMRRFFGSMYARMFVTMVAVTLLPVVILQIFYTNYVINVIRQNRIEIIRDYSSLIANEILETAYLDNASSDSTELINGEISQFCGLYDGRSLVVDRDFNVRYDTYGMVQGLKLVSEESINAMKGIEDASYNKDSDQITITYLISEKNNSETAGASESGASSAETAGASGDGASSAETAGASGDGASSAETAGASGNGASSAETAGASENGASSAETVKASEKSSEESLDSDGYEINETISQASISADDVQGMLMFVVSCADLTKVYKGIVQTMTYVIIGVGALLIFISYSLSRKFTDPFNSMSVSINKIAEGRFDEKLELKGFNEIEQISDAFNTMLSKLKALEDSRQEFVSNVSHELKTPLTSMKVLADSLNMQPDVPVEFYQEFMQDITKEIDRETDIINDLLSLVRMDKTSSDLNIAEVDINDMLETLIKRLRPIASRRSVTMELKASDHVIAQCDEIKLSLALSNLMENAIKYNIASGWVKVSLDCSEDFFFVAVADSGIGIPAQSQEKVFDRFYRVDKARSRESGGTGLGLAITKQIIMMHHGAIKVSSKEDEGTTFSVRIPLEYTKDA